LDFLGRAFLLELLPLSLSINVQLSIACHGEVYIASFHFPKFEHAAILEQKLSNYMPKLRFIRYVLLSALMWLLIAK